MARKKPGWQMSLTSDPADRVALADVQYAGGFGIDHSVRADLAEAASEVDKTTRRDQCVLATITHACHLDMLCIADAGDLIGARGHRRAAIEDVDIIFEREALIFEHS